MKLCEKLALASFRYIAPSSSSQVVPVISKYLDCFPAIRADV
jgi:hypothetical protein